MHPSSGCGTDEPHKFFERVGAPGYATAAAGVRELAMSQVCASARMQHVLYAQECQDTSVMGCTVSQVCSSDGLYHVSSV